MDAKDLGWRQFDPFLSGGRFKLSFENDPIFGRLVGISNHSYYDTWWVWTTDNGADIEMFTSRKGWNGEDL